MEEECGEERAERKVWSECSICKGEYSKDIRMNGDCLHSYCKDCIEENAKFSQLCPVCSKPLSSPLSSLPINYSILHWRSLSPPLLTDKNNNNINNLKTVNVKIELHKINNSINKRIKLEEEKECTSSPLSQHQKRCEECEENKAELHCNDCSFFFCTPCSKQVHSLKVMKNHSISLYNEENDIGKNSKNIQSKYFTKYFFCDLHHQKKKELFCERCKECVCVYCIVDNHKSHAAISVVDKVADIQSNWLNDVKKLTDKQYEILISKENIILKQVKEIDEEIDQLEDKLKLLKEKRSPLSDLLDDISDSKVKVNLTFSFLSSFLHSLPPLPLSSFISSSNSNVINNNNNNNNNNNVDDDNTTNINVDGDDDDNIDNTTENNTKKRIKDFFDMKNLKELFSSLLPISIQGGICSLQALHISSIHNNTPLILNDNLIYRSKDNQFDNPSYITFSDKLNMMGISDWGNNKVKIMDKKGTLLRSFLVEKPGGIAIIPSLQLLAVSSGLKHVIEMFDISPLLPPNNNLTHNNNNNDDSSSPLPLLYSIRKEGLKGDNFQHPTGIGYSEGKRILAVVDSGNNRIEIFKVRRDGCDHHSFIPLSITLLHIAISTPGDLILFCAFDARNKTSVFIYKEDEKRKGTGKNLISWRKEGEIRPPSLQPLANARGIAIHSPLNYCVICDFDYRILFFNITTRDLICSYQPTLPPPSPSLYYFQIPYGISIDEEANLISVTDVGLNSISLFRSPIF